MIKNLKLYRQLKKLNLFKSTLSDNIKKIISDRPSLKDFLLRVFPIISGSALAMSRVYYCCCRNQIELLLLLLSLLNNNVLFDSESFVLKTKRTKKNSLLEEKRKN